MFNDIEPLMAEWQAPAASEIVLSAESFSNSFALYYESEIVLEDWMLHAEHAHHSIGGTEVADLISEQQEDEIPIESWMTEPAFDSDKLLARYILEEKEFPIPVEAWMLKRF